MSRNGSKAHPLFLHSMYHAASNPKAYEYISEGFDIIKSLLTDHGFLAYMALPKNKMLFDLVFETLGLPPHEFQRSNLLRFLFNSGDIPWTKYVLNKVPIISRNLEDLEFLMGMAVASMNREMVPFCIRVLVKIMG